MAEPKSILIINPNSTSSMTDALVPLVLSLDIKDTAFTYFTAPSGPTSINNEEDAALSAKHCLAVLPPLLPNHAGFLVACYSQHPLVPALQAHVGAQGKPVTGIFEASVAASLQLLQPGESFGIVSTGKVWEAILSEAVANLLGTDGSSGSGSGSGVASSRFAGVETTGLSATELHDVPAAEVRDKMKAATKRLLRRGNVSVVCLGCAGMAGMNEMVREAAVEELGPNRGEKVRIVDGVQAGAAWLDGAVRMGF